MLRVILNVSICHVHLTISHGHVIINCQITNQFKGDQIHSQ